jgi:cell division protein YceG involved in septum cleavage
MLSNFTLKVIDSGVISDMGSIEILDIINLASIVEKEERNPDEKSTVAGILKKRLDEGWMIGADITVCYPFRLTAEQCKLSVTKYLYEVNDYNTRQKV